MFPSILTCQCRHNVAVSLRRLKLKPPQELALLASAYQKFNIITPYASPSFSFSHSLWPSSIVHRPSVLAIIFDFLRFLRPAARAAPADSGEPGKPGELEVKRPSAGACGCECEETHLAIVHLPRQASKHLATIHIHLRCA